MMGERAAPDRRERLIEAAATLAALLLYVVVVSRGELLPYAGAARRLTAPALAALLAALLIWRLRGWLGSDEARGLARRWAPVVVVGGLAVAIRLTALAWAGPARPDETAAVDAALRVIGNQPPAGGDAVATALGWLHAPVAALRYVAGVSDGRWQHLAAVTPEAVLSWSRGLHALLALAAIAAVGWAAARLAGRGVGLLAALLLAASGAGLAAGAHVDLAAPLHLLVALGLALGVRVGMAGEPARPAGLAPVRLARLPRLALAVVLAVGLIGLWLPGLIGAAVAPAAAVAGGLAIGRFAVGLPARAALDDGR
jgi:hypothetical protein